MARCRHRRGLSIRLNPSPAPYTDGCLNCCLSLQHTPPPRTACLAPPLPTRTSVQCLPPPHSCPPHRFCSPPLQLVHDALYQENGKWEPIFISGDRGTAPTRNRHCPTHRNGMPTAQLHSSAGPIDSNTMPQAGFTCPHAGTPTVHACLRQHRNDAVGAPLTALARRTHGAFAAAGTLRTHATCRPRHRRLACKPRCSLARFPSRASDTWMSPTSADSSPRRACVRACARTC